MAKAEQALRIANSTKRLLNVEHKHVDNGATLTPANTDFSSKLLLNAALQGDTNETRDGSSIKFLSCHVKGFMFKDGAVTQSFVRILLVQDTVPDGVVPSVTDILDTADINSHYNTENMGTKYKVLKDKTYSLSDGSGEGRTFRFYKKLNMKTRYVASTGAITDISQNALWIFMIGNDTSLQEPTVTFRTRCMFVDN